MINSELLDTVGYSMCMDLNDRVKSWSLAIVEDDRKIFILHELSTQRELEDKRKLNDWIKQNSLCRRLIP
jgi:hypothetical protein